jgi:hypothetical protein
VRVKDLSITAADKLRCCERELRYRHRVYPQLVASGKMSPGTADRELKVMAEVVEDLREQAEAEKLL